MALIRDLVIGGSELPSLSPPSSRTNTKKVSSQPLQHIKDQSIQMHHNPTGRREKELAIKRHPWHYTKGVSDTFCGQTRSHFLDVTEV